MIDGRKLFLKKKFYLLKNFFYRNILFSEKSSLRRLPDLAVDTVVGADLVWNKINPKGPSQTSGRNRTIKMTEIFSSFENRLEYQR